MRRLLRPPAISSKSITLRTFSRSCLTSRMLQSASRSAVQISFSMAFKTFFLLGEGNLEIFLIFTHPQAYLFIDDGGLAERVQSLRNFTT